MSSLDHQVVVDSHVHVVSSDQERYPLQPSGVGNRWYLEHPVDVASFITTMDAAGVDAAILVQAFGAYGYDNRYVLDAAHSTKRLLCSVVIVDVTQEGAGPLLRRLVAHDGASGVRVFAIGPLDQPQPAWLDDPETFPVWEAAADLAVPVVVTILAPQLPQLARVVERFPHVPVVLDHCGFPDLSDGSPYRAADSLFRLADLPSLHLKVTSHLLDTSGDPRDLVDRLVSEFGTDRLLWGSDYPQTHDRPYGALVDLGRHACSKLDPAGQDAFLGGNALRLWPMLDDRS